MVNSTLDKRLSRRDARRHLTGRKLARGLVFLFVMMSSGCTVVDVTTRDATGKKKTAWGLQTPFGEIGARATDGSNRRMKIVVEKPEPGSYVQTGDSGQRYVQTGANWQPRDPQPQMDSGQRYVSTGASWQPKDAHYQADSGQRYVNSGASWQPHEPQYQKVSGQQYVNASGFVPREPNYERDSGQRYVSVPAQSSRGVESTHYTGLVYVQSQDSLIQEHRLSSADNHLATAATLPARSAPRYVYQTFSTNTTKAVPASLAPLTAQQKENYRLLGVAVVQIGKEGWYVVSDKPVDAIKGLPKLYRSTHAVAEKLSDPTQWGLTIPGPVRENPIR